MIEKNIDTGTIGERIQERRKELGLSLEELAFRIGYRSGAAISFIENGKWGISADKLLEISDVLGVNPGWLLGKKEKMPDDQLKNFLAETISRDQELIEDDRFQDPRDKERMVGELRFARKLASILLEGEKTEDGGDYIE